MPPSNPFPLEHRVRASRGGMSRACLRLLAYATPRVENAERPPPSYITPSALPKENGMTISSQTSSQTSEASQHGVRAAKLTSFPPSPLTTDPQLTLCAWPRPFHNGS